MAQIGLGSLRRILALAIFTVSLAGFGATKFGVMVANTTTGPNQSYDPGEGIRMFQALKPDIVLINEFNYGRNTDSDLAKFMELSFPAGFHYFREPGGQQIPNGVISRFPFLKTGVLDDPGINNRGIAWALIELPGTTKLWVYSAHLSHGDMQNRTIGARIMLEHAQKNAAAGDYIIIGGDFNTTTRNEPGLLLLRNSGLMTDEHIPKTSSGDTDTNIGRTKPYDQFWASLSLNKHHRCVEFLADPNEPRVEGQNVFSDGLVFDPRDFALMDRVRPVTLKDGNAEQLQHLPLFQMYEVP